MWMAKQIARTEKKSPAADLSQVAAKETIRPGTVSELLFCSPPGISYKASAYARGILLDTSVGTVCPGTLMENQNIEEGELYLFSQGGAYIYLKNNGEVEINGQIIPAVSAAAQAKEE